MFLPPTPTGKRSASSLPSQRAFINLRRGTPGPVPAPIENITEYASEFELAQVEQSLVYSAVGSAETVQRKFRGILERAKPDELMLAGHFYDHAARLRSFQLAAEVLKPHQ